ncbi:hypothetical protein [Novispirillum itersonii]|uniref:hypothetical protein n=1 Tax=Novispirillum itersonii TaxID=189 RepID=UPI000379F80E|nr:hypothetical protein [Novispirillum itersonii]
MQGLIRPQRDPHHRHRDYSERQAERRVRAEAVFHAACDRHRSGAPLHFAALAAEEGFADQAHLSREVRRITGFPPGDFARRFAEDESFWLYRLWV